MGEIDPLQTWATNPHCDAAIVGVPAPDHLFCGLGARVTRRKFIALLGVTAIGWPIGARTQQPPVRVIGFLSAESLQHWWLRLFARPPNFVTERDSSFIGAERTSKPVSTSLRHQGEPRR